jgi:hypothetical protein
LFCFLSIPFCIRKCPFHQTITYVFLSNCLTFLLLVLVGPHWIHASFHVVPMQPCCSCIPHVPCGSTLVYILCSVVFSLAVP